MKIDNKELEKIFSEIKENKTEGIENLYNKYKKVVYGIAFMISKNQEDAEDIMQIVFTKIYELENSKIPLSNYATWIYSVTKNETINYLKKKKNDIQLDKVYEIQNDNNELKELINNIDFNNLINKLNDEEKEIVSLKIVSNFSFQEIAKLLRKPVGTVKWRYYKSIYNLKAILGNLVMFIISGLIGTKTLLSKKKTENFSQIENFEQNSTQKEELTNSALSDKNIFKDETKNSTNESKQEESIRQDINTNTNNNTNIIQNNNINIQENIIYQEQHINNYNQFIGYSFLSISLIFFIITVYFFIKYQPKHLKKLSK